MRTLATVSFAALVWATAGCGGNDQGANTARDAEKAAAKNTPATSETVELELREQNRSGQSGTATLAQGVSASKMDVVLVVEGAKDGQPAHIHNVTCAEYANITEFQKQLATVAEDLGVFVGGKADQQVVVFEDAALAARTTGEYSINVHETGHPYAVTACGDIPKR